MKTSSNAVLLNCNDTETPTQKTPEIYRFKNSFKDKFTTTYSHILQ